jgi:dTDP-4-dehydrorhamnose reductase
MVGAQLVEILGADPRLEVLGAARDPAPGVPGFDAERDDPAQLLGATSCDWVVNAIGVLRARIDESDRASVERAIEVNERFPHRLASALGERRLIHLSTDAVFSGASAPYSEHAEADAVDVYGRSKARGEPRGGGVHCLRCSVIGPEPGEPRSLLGWALRQPSGARIDGYSDTTWNGLTTLALGRLCGALIGRTAQTPPSPLHLVPADSVSKAELLELALEAFGRTDVRVEPALSGRAVDLTLTTAHPEAGARLWAAAGYAEPPTIAAMLTELADAAGRRSQPPVG